MRQWLFHLTDDYFVQRYFDKQEQNGKNSLYFCNN